MSETSKQQHVAQLLEYFYLVHYQVTMVLEDVMRGPLSRKEAALLFLLYVEGGTDRSLPRKLVVEKLNSWFDATSSNVTKIIARMASPQMKLVQVTNEPGSARDKRIRLTSNGHACIRSMLKRGEDHSGFMLGGISDAQIQSGLEFFRSASAATNAVLPLNKFALTRIRRKR